jgi:GNAT superfamily N-acetyltransferase
MCRNSSALDPPFALTLLRNAAQRLRTRRDRIGLLGRAIHAFLTTDPPARLRPASTLAAMKAHRTTTRIYPHREANAIATLTLAFATDPPSRWFWPATSDFLAAFPVFARALGGRAFASESGFEVGEGAGVALWLPPGVEPDEAELIDVVQRTVHASRQSQLFEMIQQMGQHHPQRPHWYLPFVGVEPLHQSRGLGATVLWPILQRCDRERLPAYLESTNPRNIPFYERLGFRQVGVIRSGDSPEIVPMVREPH